MATYDSAKGPAVEGVSFPFLSTPSVDETIRKWYRSTLSHAFVIGGVGFLAPDLWNAMNDLAESKALSRTSKRKDVLLLLPSFYAAYLSQYSSNLKSLFRHARSRSDGVRLELRHPPLLAAHIGVPRLQAPTCKEAHYLRLLPRRLLVHHRLGIRLAHPRNIHQG